MPHRKRQRQRSHPRGSRRSLLVFSTALIKGINGHLWAGEEVLPVARICLPCVQCSCHWLCTLGDNYEVRNVSEWEVDVEKVPSEEGRENQLRWRAHPQRLDSQYMFLNDIWHSPVSCCGSFTLHSIQCLKWEAHFANHCSCFGLKEQAHQSKLRQQYAFQQWISWLISSSSTDINISLSSRYLIQPFKASFWLFSHQLSSFWVLTVKPTIPSTCHILFYCST